MNDHPAAPPPTRSARLPAGIAPTPRSAALADDERLAALAKAIGHPARVRILRHLLAAEACMCGAIQDVLPLAQSTVSQHLKVLKEAGLIVGEIDGPRVCYSPERTVLAELTELLERLEPTERPMENTDA
jgi:ArsR family transcriptional regulator, arsenate/arsenite/antimonite-responsive transcriptional repressor